MAEKCKNCAYYDKIDEIGGNCYGLPPIMTLAVNTLSKQDPLSLNVYVMKDRKSCSLFKLKE